MNPGSWQMNWLTESSSFRIFYLVPIVKLTVFIFMFMACILFWNHGQIPQAIVDKESPAWKMCARGKISPVFREINNCDFSPEKSENNIKSWIKKVLAKVHIWSNLDITTDNGNLKKLELSNCKPNIGFFFFY